MSLADQLGEARGGDWIVMARVGGPASGRVSPVQVKGKVWRGTEAEARKKASEYSEKMNTPYTVNRLHYWAEKAR